MYIILNCRFMWTRRAPAPSLSASGNNNVGYSIQPKMIVAYKGGEDVIHGVNNSTKSKFYIFYSFNDTYVENL